MISKKHFEAIVKILADNKYKDHTNLLNDFCKFFKSENPNPSFRQIQQIISLIDVKRI